MEYKKINELCVPFSSNISINKLEGNTGEYPLYGAAGFVKNVDFFLADKPYISIIKDGAGVGRIAIHKEKSSIVGTMQGIYPKENINIKWLYYVLKNQQLDKNKTGVTIPHIYFKDYGKNVVKVVEIDEQIKMVECLENIECQIMLKQKQLIKLDEVVKSQFIEMFGDVLTNTKDFEMCCFGDYVTQMNIGPFGSDLKNEDFVTEDESYCMVYEQKHAIQKSLELETRYVNELKYNKLKRFDVGPGDIIVSCRGTIGECFILPNDAPNGIIHPSLMMIKPKNIVNNRFLVFLLEHILVEQTEQGSGVKMAIKATELAKIKTIKPKRCLQDQFINFVQQIDKSKFLIKKQIELLREILEIKMDEYFN